jgi:hypothetical protein
VFLCIGFPFERLLGFNIRFIKEDYRKLMKNPSWETVAEEMVVAHLTRERNALFALSTAYRGRILWWKGRD